MKICKRQKKQRPPLQPRVGPYTKTNAYTTRPSVEQIVILDLTVIVVVLHSVFNVAAIIAIDHPILYILLAIDYCTTLGLIVTYVQITSSDPVDSYIVDPLQADIEQKFTTRRYCPLCRSLTQQKSYHCKRCGRCTEEFDHHCVYLNTCIGSKNYELFFRIVLLFIMFLAVHIGEAAWVFVVALKNEQVKKACITEWVSIAIIVICAVALLASVSLIIFHCYISCCLDVTTLMFVQSEPSQKDRKQFANSMNNLVSNAISENIESQKNFVASDVARSAGFLFLYLLLDEIILQHQQSKVEGSGFGTLRLFWNKNSARQSTGSSGNSARIFTIPSDRIGTRLTSRYFLSTSELLSKVSLSSFCSFSFFIIQSSFCTFLTILCLLSISSLAFFLCSIYRSIFFFTWL